MRRQVGPRGRLRRPGSLGEVGCVQPRALALASLEERGDGACACSGVPKTDPGRTPATSGS